MQIHNLVFKGVSKQH